MNIPATELKKTLRLLAPVRSEVFHVGEHGVSAQDSDVWVVVDSPLSQLGSFTVAGKKLTQVANRMSGTVSLELKDNQLTLKSAKAEIVLEAKPAKKATLPATPEKTVSLPAADFKKALSVAVASASPNKSAGFGGVVQFKSAPLGFDSETPDGYRLVGTDSKVLTVVGVDGALPFEIAALVNLTACGVVQIMENETITYGDGEKGLCLKSGNLTVFAAKPDQQYPNIDPLLATAPTVTFKFKPEEWLAALRMVEPLIEEEEGESKVALHFSEGVVGFDSSGSTSTSTARDEAGYEQVLPDPILEPKEMTIVMEASHLSGFLSKSSGEATLSFSEMKKPLMLECGGVKVLTFPRKGSKK